MLKVEDIKKMDEEEIKKHPLREKICTCEMTDEEIWNHVKKGTQYTDERTIMFSTIRAVKNGMSIQDIYKTYGIKFDKAEKMGLYDEQNNL